MNKFKTVFICLSMIVTVLVASASIAMAASNVNFTSVDAGKKLASTAVKGDINCDSKLTSADYHLLEKYLSGYDTSKITNFDAAKLDYNEDGVVDMQDLLKMGYDASDMGMYSPNY